MLPELFAAYAEIFADIQRHNMRHGNVTGGVRQRTRYVQRALSLLYPPETVAAIMKRGEDIVTGELAQQRG